MKYESPYIGDDLAPQMAIKAVNDSVGPNGTRPTLSVYGAITRLGLVRDRPFPSTHRRSIAATKATHAITKHFAFLQVCDALCAYIGPKMSDILSAPI